MQRPAAALTLRRATAAVETLFRPCPIRPRAPHREHPHRVRQAPTQRAEDRIWSMGTKSGYEVPGSEEIDVAESA